MHLAKSHDNNMWQATTERQGLTKKNCFYLKQKTEIVLK